MNNREKIVESWIRDIKNEIETHKYAEYFDKQDIDTMHERLNLTEEQLITVMCNRLNELGLEVAKLKSERCAILRELECAQRVIDSMIKSNKEAILKKRTSWTYRQALVAAGLPIAKRKSGEGNLFDVFVALEDGLSDDEIMEKYKLSRSTLWRRKKEIEKCKKEKRLPI